MGITPTKRRGKSKVVPTGAPTPEQISKLLTVWLGKMPAEQAKFVTGGRVAHFPPRLEDEVASWSALMMHACHYDPITWTVPPFFADTRMGRAVTWLQQLPKVAYLDARENAAKILQAAWPQVEAALQSADACYHTIPDLWRPDEEFAPFDAPAPYLPCWRIDDPDPQVAAIAKASEEFAVYALLVTWFNAELNFGLLDVHPRPF